MRDSLLRTGEPLESIHGDRTCSDISRIELCPLHAAAPAMYEALQAMVIANHGLPINPMDEKDEICRRALEKAQKALAQAEGK